MSITHGLTDQQKACVDEILAPSRGFARRGGGIDGGLPSNHAMEGWWLFRTPSVLNPPTDLAMRYRDGKGVVVREIWITRHREHVYDPAAAATGLSAVPGKMGTDSYAATEAA